MIRVLIADDHGVVREGLSRLLQAAEGIEVAGVAADGEAAVAQAQAVVPDVVLMDLDMPGIDGIEATRRISAGNGTAAVLVLTSFSDQPRILGAIEAGAVGYLLKDASSEDVVAGIRAAARGESPLDPRAARIMLTTRNRPAPASALSGREKEVLVLVADGMANKQIARILGIAERTVKAHLTSIFNQIGVTDRTSAALWAHRRGLVGAPPSVPPGR
jgi:DNA-binding NarL/FixJ family response regulator